MKKQQLMKKMKATKEKTKALTKKAVEQITIEEFEELRADFIEINKNMDIITERLQSRS